ncbi:hypothetical protein GCM10009850_122080 [Nonomuraea monospora]|uniref:Cytochrome P450 n=1 Tax=Nonomuraea monospora TaxID=568818 RepID=A0ABN3D594_9ACTN
MTTYSGAKQHTTPHEGPGAAEAPPVFSLPDLALPFPASAARHDSEALRREASRWALDQGLIGPRGHDRLLRPGLLDAGIALSGDAPRERAVILLQWVLWTLLLDDRIDDGHWADDGVLDTFTEAARRIVEHGPGHRHDDPMLKTLAGDLWPRTRRLGGPAWQSAIAGHVVRHLRAQCRMTASRAPSLAAYTAMRRDLLGADLLFDLIEAVHGLNTLWPGDLDALVTRLRDCAGDVLSWTNDVYSLEKDLLLREDANLVKIVRRERGVAWQAAVDTVQAMIMRRVDAFQTAQTELALHPPSPGRDRASALAHRLSAAMAAGLSWHRSVGRYHWQRSAATIDTARTPPSLVWTEFERDPYPLYARLRRHFPLMRDEPLDAWVISRYDDVRAALCHPDVTSQSYAWQVGAMLGRTLLEMDGREHTVHRALLSPAFRGHAMTALRRTAHTAAAGLAAGTARQIRDTGQADLATGFCRQLPITVLTRVLGLPLDDAELLRPWYTAGFAYMSDHRQDPLTLQRGLAARDDLYDYLRRHLAARRARLGDDLLSTLCTSLVDGRPLDDEEIMGCCAVLLAAGADTTDRALALFAANLLDNPGALAELRHDPALADAAWAESLRRDPPTQIVIRHTTEPVELPSGRLPPDATVVCLLASANRDPDRFPDPDRYDVHRAEASTDRQFAASAAHLAFGAGRHFCLGAHLARLLGTTMPILLRALPGLRWADGFTPTQTGLISRGPDSLLITMEGER